MQAVLVKPVLVTTGSRMGEEVILGVLAKGLAGVALQREARSWR